MKYVCYIKKQDRVKDETKTIIVSEKELENLIEGRKVQGHLMNQIEMIVTEENTKITPSKMTAIQYLKDEYRKRGETLPSGVFQEALEMYKKEMEEMYRLGYLDCQVNHVEDAKNAVEEYIYTKDK